MKSKCVYKYKSKHSGITYYEMRCNYNNYEIDFDLYQKDNIWVSEFESYDDDVKSIIFKSVNKIDCLNQMYDFVKYQIDNNLVRTLQDQKYKIDADFPEVMFSVYNMDIGYHISENVNRTDIMTNGLIGAGNPDKDVVAASELIHTYRPFWIPQWVDRRKALYANPMFNNYGVRENRQNCDLYAVYLHPEYCWVGSQGLGGFCLDAGEDYTSEEYKQYNITSQWLEQHRKDLIGYAKDYWWYSCSLKNYRRNDPFVHWKDKYYGLDEILIVHPIKQFDLIGSWDAESKFSPNQKFVKYVKPQFKITYQNILDKY